MDKHTEKSENHDEWWSKIKAVSEASAKPMEVESHTGKLNNNTATTKEVKKSLFTLQNLILAILVFVIAVLPRLYYLFFLTDPQNVGIDWYGDVYHHWQIAYLSKEIGFSHGFLRLWDFKGLEYYWGLLHPLFLTFLFTITGSISIVIPRLVSVIFGALNILLIYLIIKKHFNSWAAWGAVIFSTFLPVTLFSDTLGMQEPFGLFFLLLGIYLISGNAILAGVLLMAGGMVRSEYWIFGAVLVVVALFRLKHSNKKWYLLLGYLITCLVYMKYLLNNTANPIYPIWTAYLGTFVGDWNIPRPLTPHQIELQIIFRIAFFIVLAIMLFLFWKRPKAYLFLLLGFGNIGFFLLMHAFGSRMGGWIDDTWNGVDRLLSFPYEFLGAVFAILFLYYLPKISKFLKPFGMIFLLAVLVAVQPSWMYIEKWHSRAMQPSWDRSITNAQGIAKNWDGNRVMIISAGDPSLTYTLSYFHKIPANKLMSDMYSPFYYAASDPFADWPKFRKKMIKWFKQYNAGYLVYVGNFSPNDQMGKMLQLEDGKVFNLKSTNGYYRIYEIKT